MCAHKTNRCTSLPIHKQRQADTQTYEHIHTLTDIYTIAWTRTHTHTHTHTHIHTHTHTYTHTHSHTHTNTNTHKHTDMHTHTHTHMLSSSYDAPYAARSEERRGGRECRSQS